MSWGHDIADNYAELSSLTHWWADDVHHWYFDVLMLKSKISRAWLHHRLRQNNCARQNSSSNLYFDRCDKNYTTKTTHRASTSTRWHLAFGLCCHSHEFHAPIANQPSSEQLGGTLAILPTYIWIRAVVWNTATDWQTDTQTHRQTDARDQYTFRVVYDSREM